MNIKINSNKGVTLVTLVTAVLMLIIMTSMLVYNTTSGMNIKKYNNMCNDIQLLNDKILAYYSKYKAIPAGIMYCNKGELESIIGDNNININDDDKYYVIDLSAINGLTLTYGENYISGKTVYNIEEEKDVYIINKQSGQIYYPQGIKLEGVYYYTNGPVDNEAVNIE